MSTPTDKKAGSQTAAESRLQTASGESLENLAVKENIALPRVSHDVAQSPGVETKPPDQLESPRLLSRVGKWLATGGELSESIRKILLNGIIVILLVLLAWTAIVEIRQKTVILDPIEVPRELADRGHSPTAVALRLNDEIEAIVNDGRTYFPEGTREKDVIAAKLLAGAERPDMEVPGGNFSLRTVVRYLRYALGFPETRIGGSVSKQDEQMYLVLRTTGQESRPAVTLEAATLNDLLSLGAQQIVTERSPLLVAGYFLNNPDKDKDFTKTEAAIKYSLEKRPNESPQYAYFMWAQLLRERNRPNEAIEKYLEASRLDPNEPTTYNNWGNVLSEMGRHSEAIEKYQKAAELSKQPHDAAVFYRNWCSELIDIGSADAAIEKCRKAVELKADYANAYHEWGTALGDLKRYDEAIEKYQKALEFNNNFTAPYVGWGIALADLERYEEAIEKYKKATEINPNNMYAHFNWGIALEKLKRYEEASEKYGTIIQINPKDSEVYRRWGDVLLKIGKRKEAKEKFEKARELVEPN